MLNVIIYSSHTVSFAQRAFPHFFSITSLQILKTFFPLNRYTFTLKDVASRMIFFVYFSSIFIMFTSALTAKENGEKKFTADG